jgi:two-component system phosphate regulon response regulator OmpR
MPARILVVDDDARLRDLLQRFLNEHEFLVETASNADEARTKLNCKNFDAIVLDVMMPGETGMQFAKICTQTYGIPILMLTACHELNDKIAAFDLGVDDYLTKPFEPAELLARLRSILKRVPKSAPPPVYQFGPFSFSPQTGELLKGQESVHLSFTEIILLRKLTQAPHTPFSRHTLAQCMGHQVDDRTVDVQIARLRKKLQDDPRRPKIIQTIRHVGYALCPD